MDLRHSFLRRGARFVVLFKGISPPAAHLRCRRTHHRRWNRHSAPTAAGPRTGRAHLRRNRNVQLQHPRAFHAAVSPRLSGMARRRPSLRRGNGLLFVGGADALGPSCLTATFFPPPDWRTGLYDPGRFCRRTRSRLAARFMEALHRPAPLRQVRRAFQIPGNFYPPMRRRRRPFYRARQP